MSKSKQMFRLWAFALALLGLGSMMMGGMIAKISGYSEFRGYIAGGFLSSGMWFLFFVTTGAIIYALKK